MILSAILWTSNAHTTTYNFIEFGFNFALGEKVNLSADTSNYTGTLSLQPGDTATFGQVTYPDFPATYPIVPLNCYSALGSF